MHFVILRKELRMPTDFSFEGICKSLKNDFPEIVEDIDNISSVILAVGVAVTASPVAAAIGVGIAPLAIAATAVGTLSSVLGVKDTIVKLLTKVIDKITSKKESGLLQQLERMERAYYLICYTSFFEALAQEKQLAPLLKKAKMTQDKKLLFSETASERLWRKSGQIDKTGKEPIESLLNFKFALPHPTAPFQQQKEQLMPLYKQLSEGAKIFFSSLVAWQEVNGQEQTTIEEVLKKLPDKSYEYFKAQYYLLSTKYEDFYIWATLQEHEKTRTQQEQIYSAFIQKYIEISKESQQSSDTGFKNLAEVVSLLPKTIEQQNTSDILQSLERTYKYAVEKTIVDIEIDKNRLNLNYPLKKQIFIPQAFQVI